MFFSRSHTSSAPSRVRDRSTGSLKVDCYCKNCFKWSFENGIPNLSLSWNRCIDKSKWKFSKTIFFIDEFILLEIGNKLPALSIIANLLFSTGFVEPLTKTHPFNQISWFSDCLRYRCLNVSLKNNDGIQWGRNWTKVKEKINNQWPDIKNQLWAEPQCKLIQIITLIVTVSNTLKIFWSITRDWEKEFISANFLISKNGNSTDAKLRN